MNEREFLAAEHALRLLEGEELLEARQLEATDSAFAGDVRTWEAWFAPLLEGIAPVEPRADLWHRIEQLISRTDSGANVVQWRRRVRTWQGVAAAFAAAAAVLALIALPTILRPPAPTVPTVQPVAPLLVATLAVEEGPGAVSVTYVPTRRDLLVNAAALTERADQDHQLWVIPEGGTPISLGLVSADQPQTQRLSAELARQLRTGASIALSVEPSGGSPTGQPTGPVIATGSLREV